MKKLYIPACIILMHTGIFIFNASAFNIYPADNNRTYSYGTGCAADRKKALEFALADLSGLISSEVTAETFIKQTSSSVGISEYTSYKVSIKTDLPILGYTSSAYDKKCIHVWLEPDKTVELYKNEIDKIVNYIDTTIENIKNLPPQSHLKKYKELPPYYERLNKLAVVYFFLTSKHPATPSKNLAYIENAIRKLSDTPHDLNQASANIKNGLTSKNYNVASVLLRSGEQTELGSTLTYELSKGIKNSDKNSDTLKCSYSYDTNIHSSLLVSCFLTTKEGVIKESAYTEIDKEICLKIKCAASNISKNSIDLSSPEIFRGYFYTDYTADGLILNSGDILRLYYRINNVCQIGLIYTSPDGKKYIIPVNGDYIYTVAASDLNAEKTLGVFKISPPYGIDTFTLVAFKGDLAKLLNLKQIDGKGPVQVDNISKYPERDMYFERHLTFITAP